MAGRLRDLMQSASNVAASNVSGPVDLIGMLLRYGGIPVPQNSIGSSQWMAQRGLTAPVQQGAAQVTGETLGLLAPFAAAAKAPQIASAMIKGGENLAVPRTLNPQTGAIVYHGSPHKFDKFDSSKIGTGEGAQAYGHGLYLADHPEVAKGYSAIADQNPTAQQYLRMWGGDKVKAEAAFLKDVQEGAFGKYTLQIAKDGDVLASIRGKGQLYKVDLPDEQIAKMLDWDKPLSQQAPEVQAALKDAGIDPAKHGGTGATLISELKGRPGIADMPWMGRQESHLKQAGIPGIRYLDGGSRTAGQGTSNYVVFPGNEDMLRILERNGQQMGSLSNLVKK